MKEIRWELSEGKEVPSRLNGQEVVYSLPEAASELLASIGQEGTVSFSGSDEAQKILVSVFNEGLELNHRQKIAKRFAAKEGSTITSIQEGMSKHKPGIRAAGTGEKRVPSKLKAERSAVDEMLAELRARDPQAAEKYEARLATLRAKPAKAAVAAGESQAAPQEASGGEKGATRRPQAVGGNKGR